MPTIIMLIVPKSLQKLLKHSHNIVLRNIHSNHSSSAFQSLANAILKRELISRYNLPSSVDGCHSPQRKISYFLQEMSLGSR